MNDFAAALTLKRGRAQGHSLTEWHMAEVRFEKKPSIVKIDDAPKPRLLCTACGAYALILTDEGVIATSQSFDKPCTAPAPRAPEAA